MSGKFALSLIAFFSFLYTSTSLAAQRGVVVTDGSMVYKMGNFDAPVIGYFKRGQKVTISNKVYGAFYRVRFKQGVIGFVSDADVVPEKMLKKQGGSSGKTSSTMDRKDKKSSGKPLFRRYMIGGGLAFTQYRELIAKAEKQDDILTYGIKLSMPGFFEGPFFIDANLQFTSSAPEYYSEFSSDLPSGNLMLFDILLMFHIDNFITRSTSIYLGAGPMAAYSTFTIDTGDGSSFVSEEVRGGAAFALGFAHLIGPVAIKLEPRYYLEKANYFSVLAGAQYSF